MSLAIPSQRVKTGSHGMPDIPTGTITRLIHG